MGLGDTLNLGQEIFLVTFSILYGVMLQVLPKGLFPLAKAFRGYIKRDGSRATNYQKAWRVRTGLSIFILNILPASYMWLILEMLTDVTIPIKAGGQLLFVISLFWSSLGVFGFYRLYLVLVILYWESILPDLICIFDEEKRALSFDAPAQFSWACIYLIPGLLYLVFLRISS